MRPLLSVSFAAAAACLAATGVLFGLNWVYYACVAAIAAMYAYGIYAITKFGESKTQLVFFYESVSISALIFAGTLSNIIFRHG